MRCSFCGATNVKLHAINYDGRFAMVCVSCKVLDGITDDKESK